MIQNLTQVAILCTNTFVRHTGYLQAIDNKATWFGLIELFELVNYGYVMMDFVNWTCETFEFWTVMMVYIGSRVCGHVIYHSNSNSNLTTTHTSVCGGQI